MEGKVKQREGRRFITFDFGMSCLLPYIFGLFSFVLIVTDRLCPEQSVPGLLLVICFFIEVGSSERRECL